MSRVSIQSKLLVMLLHDEHPVRGDRRCDRLPVGPQLVARVGVRPADRDPAVAEPPTADRDLGPEELAGDLLARLDGDAGARGVHGGLRPARAVDHQPEPSSSPSPTTTPTGSPRTSGRRRATTWTSPRSCRRRPAQQYLQAYYTVPFGDYSKPTADWDAAIKFDDARDGSAWSAANAQYNDFFREIVTRFQFEDALLLDTRGNVVYSRLQGRRPRHQHPHRPLQGQRARRRLPEGARLQRRRLRRTDRLRRLPARRRADRLVRLAGRARRAASTAFSHCSSRSPRSTG